MKSRIFIAANLGIMLLVLSGCRQSSTSPGVPDIPTVERLETTGASLMLPQAWLWLAVPGNSALEVAAVRPGDGRDETFAVHLTPIRLPVGIQPEEMKLWFAAEHEKDSAPARFRPIEQEYRHYRHPEHQAPCVDFDLLSEDTQPASASGQSESMQFQIIGRVCAHPGNPEVGIISGFSHRYYPSDADERWREHGLKLLDTVKYESLPPELEIQ